ncbi:MAG: DNA polymerase III subunit delta [Candidatus Cloacimonetes bacterium]|nr:DNA polymerase III subunit delta [Candidatus Cloacimonadota bacterium]
MNKKLKYWDLKAEVQKGIFHNNYFFTDDESYLKDKAFALLKDALVPLNVIDFNYEIFYGEETKANEVMEALQSPPMLSDTKLVILRNFQTMHITYKKKIVDYLQKPIKEAVLVIEADKVNTYSGLYAKIAKLADTYYFYHPYNESEAIRFLREESVALNKSIDNDAARIMVDYIGLDCQELHSELEKVALYSGGRNHITPEDVQACIGASKGNTIYELQGALTQRNFQQAMKVLENLMANNMSPVLIVIMLTRFYTTLWDILIQRFQQNRSKTEIERTLGNWNTKSFMNAAEFYSLENFDEIFALLLEADRKLKSVDTKLNKTILEMMIYKMCKDV